MPQMPPLPSLCQLGDFCSEYPLLPSLTITLLTSACQPLLRESFVLVPSPPGNDQHLLGPPHCTRRLCTFVMAGLSGPCSSTALTAGSCKAKHTLHLLNLAWHCSLTCGLPIHARRWESPQTSALVMFQDLLSGFFPLLFSALSDPSGARCYSLRFHPSGNHKHF